MDYFEFIYWLASKFDNYWEIDKNTKNGLWEFYVNERTKGTIDDLDEYKEPCKKTCSDTFYSPYIDAQEVKDVYEVINGGYSPIPIPTHFDINNFDELCKIEEFPVVQHSIGNDEEFVTIGPSNINTVKRTPGSMSSIYHELLNKKDRGWELLSYKGSTDPKHLGPTSGIRATRETLSKKNHKNNKHSLSGSRKMSHPADEFSQHLSDDDVSNHEDASDNKGGVWYMGHKMDHYLEYINNDVWKVIQNGNSKKRISTGKDGVIRVLPPVFAVEIHVVKKERKARTIILMAIPKEHLRRFHGMDDAKEIWEAIRTRFGGNANSKKIQKAVVKQQFEAFSISSSKGLEKGYDRFKQLLSQLEAHGAEVSNEDANHKFLSALPLAWSNLAMTMRTKPKIDTLSIDDLYNNLRSSTNKVKSGLIGTFSTYNPSTSSSNILEREALAGFADEVIYLLFAKQSEDLDLLHKELEQIDDVDIEEMDINWQIAMIAIRMKKFYKKTGRRVRIDGKVPVGFDKKKLECYRCHNTSHFARKCTSNKTNDGKKKTALIYQDQEAGKQEQNQISLLTMENGVVNWGDHTAEEETNHALMAISSNSEVSLCSKTCTDSDNKLKAMCDEQTNLLDEQEAKLLAYSQAVKKLESQIVTFQKQQFSLNENLTFQANAIYEKDEKLKKYRRNRMKSIKEKEQLQKTVDSWKDSSKNL
ncbi:hypothetical protein Tco_1278081 [Tanacetum coccineum]